jgi:transposase
MDKSKKNTNKSRRMENFPVTNPNSAGIDVGDTEMVVAISADRCEKNVRTFGAFTSDYYEICNFLKENSITHVAMESTGVYWIQLYLILQQMGFEVILANAKHIKNVSGRKHDELDAMWIQKLHSCGLINGGFQPDVETRGLRDLMRHRQSLIQSQSQSTNRIIKALELMNIKTHTVISDIDGKTGKAIINSILQGERNAEVLASLADRRIKADKLTLEKSLKANWNDHQLYILKQQYEIYEFLSRQIKECDEQLENQIQKLIASKQIGVVPEIDHTRKRKRSTRKNSVSFNVTAYLESLLGADLTAIPGISEISALQIISEIGCDMSKWPTERHFVSWLNLVPNTKQSGGKIISSKVMKKKHRAGQVFRMAGSTLYNSKSVLGDFYRKKQARRGPATAIIATATKIAIAVYMMIKNKSNYQPQQLEKSQQKAKQYLIDKLEKRLADLKKAA